MRHTATSVSVGPPLRCVAMIVDGDDEAVARTLSMSARRCGLPHPDPGDQSERPATAAKPGGFGRLRPSLNGRGGAMSIIT